MTLRNVPMEYETIISVNGWNHRNWRIATFAWNHQFKEMNNGIEKVEEKKLSFDSIEINNCVLFGWVGEYVGVCHTTSFCHSSS